MRVPFSWIKEYVAWEGTVEEMAEVLTMSGTEVEGIDWVGAPRDPENLSRFVVGKVLNILCYAWCRRETDLNAVEMFENSAPSPVDTSMALIRNNQVEVPG